MIVAGKVNLEIITIDQPPLKVQGVGLDALETVYGTSVYVVRFNSFDFAFWDNVERSGAKDCIAVLSWANINNGGAVNESATRNLLVKDLKKNNAGGTLYITLTLVDFTFRMQNSHRRRIFENMTIAEIVAELGSANKVPVMEVDAVSGRKYTLYQSGQSDYEFIKETLIPRAFDTANVSPLLFYMREGSVLVLKQRKLEKPKLTANDTGINTDEVVTVTNYITHMIINSCNYGVRSVTFDALKKQTRPYMVEYFSDDDAAFRTDEFATKNTPQSLSSDDEAGEVNAEIVESLGADLKSSLLSRARCRFPFAEYRMAIPTRLLPKIEPGVTVKVEVKSPDKTQVLSCSGNYLLYAAHHTIIPSEDSKTTLLLERFGAE